MIAFALAVLLEPASASATANRHRAESAREQVVLRRRQHGESVAAAESVTPAAGVCPATLATVVTFELGLDLATPRCVAVASLQRLGLHNGGSATEVVLGGLTVMLQPGETATIHRPFGTYLAPGVHTLRVARYGGSGPQVWLRS